MAERVTEATWTPAPQEQLHAAGRAVEVVPDVKPVHDFARVPVLQRQDDDEDPTVAARRHAAADAARRAVEKIRKGLSGGYLWPVEAAIEGGVVVGGQGGREETFAEREARLRRLAIDLGQLASELDQTPIAAERLEPTFTTGSSNWDISGPEDWQDVLVLHTRRQAEAGVDPDLIFEDHWYIETDPVAQRQAPRARSRETSLGIYLIVPDPENAPLTYRVSTGYEGWQEKGAVVVTVWSDDFGYFYYHKGKKIYLPGRP
jgi:hypothetical protein